MDFLFTRGKLAIMIQGLQNTDKIILHDGDYQIAIDSMRFVEKYAKAIREVLEKNQKYNNSRF
jgi:hypothetical protein